MAKTRAELVSAYKSKAIALGKALKRIAKLEVSEDSWRKSAIHNKKVSENSKAEALRIREIANAQEEQCVEYHGLLKDANNCIKANEIVIEGLDAQVRHDADLIKEQGDTITRLSSDLEDFKGMYYGASSEANEHDTHRRRLSDFTREQLAALRNLIDLIDDGFTNIDNEYRE